MDIANKVMFIADSKTPTGVSEVPLTDIAVEAFQNQIELAGSGPWLSESTSAGVGSSDLDPASRRSSPSLRTTRRLKRRRGLPAAHSLIEECAPFPAQRLFSNISQAQGDHFCNDSRHDSR